MTEQIAAEKMPKPVRTVVNPPGELPQEVRFITFDVILLRQVDNGYSARPVLWPDSVAHGTTEQEALDRVRTLIRDLLSRTRFVQVELDVSEHQFGNPWLAKAGTFADDPTWDDFLQTMADYRRQLIEEQTPGLA